MIDTIKNNPFWSAVAAAVIGGLFTLAPFIYSSLSESKAAISYTLNVGPVLAGSDKDRQIVVIKISNTGGKEIHDVYLEVIVPSRFIEEAAYSRIAGVDFIEHKSSGEYKLSIPSINPLESVAVSLFVTGSKGSSSALVNVSDVIVRAPSIIPKLVDPSSQNVFSTGNSLTALTLISAILVTLWIFVTLYLRKYIRREEFMPNARTSILSYILSRTKFLDLAQSIVIDGREMKYIEVSDLLLAYGLNRDDIRDQCINALSCMLLINDMQAISRMATKRSLVLLSSVEYLEELREKSATKQKKLRLSGD